MLAMRLRKSNTFGEGFGGCGDVLFGTSKWGVATNDRKIVQS